jgi:hypothetical protein
MINMPKSQYYAGAIWTNHALERLDQRGLSQAMAGKTFQDPDKKFPGKQSGTTEFQKRFGKSWVTVIATKNEKNEWIILSCWIDPPLSGTDDHKKRQNYLKYQSAYKKAGFWGRVWLDLRKTFLGF